MTTSSSPASGSSSRPSAGPTRDGAVILGIRPGDFEDVAHAETGLPEIEVDVAVLEELGAESHVIFWVDAARVETEDSRPP